MVCVSLCASCQGEGWWQYPVGAGGPRQGFCPHWGPLIRSCRAVHLVSSLAAHRERAWLARMTYWKYNSSLMAGFITRSPRLVRTLHRFSLQRWITAWNVSSHSSYIWFLINVDGPWLDIAAEGWQQAGRLSFTVSSRLSFCSPPSLFHYLLAFLFLAPWRLKCCFLSFLKENALFLGAWLKSVICCTLPSTSIPGGQRGPFFSDLLHGDREGKWKQTSSPFYGLECEGLVPKAKPSRDRHEQKQANVLMFALG